MKNLALSIPLTFVAGRALGQGAVTTFMAWYGFGSLGLMGIFAALVAREYRIPAVLQTRDATSAILDGQTITVDGNAGTVELES